MHVIFPRGTQPDGLQDICDAHAWGPHIWAAWPAEGNQPPGRAAAQHADAANFRAPR